MQIELFGGVKEYIIFTGTEMEQAKATQVLNELKKAREDIALDSLESQQLMRIAQLKDSDMMKDFFEDFVIKNKKMTEEQFWTAFEA